ncbi:VIER F-box protein 2 [Tanacetum coccineum]
MVNTRNSKPRVLDDALRNAVMEVVQEANVPFKVTLTTIQSNMTFKIKGLLMFQNFACRLGNGEGTSNREGGYERLTKDQKLRLVSMHLYDKALECHKQFVKIHGKNVNEKEIVARFSNVFEDPMVEINNLKHEGEVKVYQEQFEVLLDRRELVEFYAVSLFISVLKSEISMSVRMFKPTTFKDTFCLARMQEATLALIKTKPVSQFFSQRSNNSSYASRYNSNVTPAISIILKPLLHLPSSSNNSTNKNVKSVFRKKLTQKELEEKEQKGCVSIVNKELPPQRNHDHAINLLPDTLPVTVRPYRLSPNQKDVVEHMVKKLLEVGVIKESQSPFSSFIVMVKKKDGTCGMCVDYMKLNNFIVKDKLPIHVVEEFIDELCGLAIDTLKIQAMNSWPIPTTLKQLRVINVSTDLLKRIQDGWQKDESLQKLIQKLHANPNTPSNLSSKLIRGHFGVSVTLQNLKSIVYWKGMRKWFKSQIRKYDVCQRNKPDLSTYPGFIQPFPIPSTISIYMDFIEANTVSRVLMDNVFKLHEKIRKAQEFTSWSGDSVEDATWEIYVEDNMDISRIERITIKEYEIEFEVSDLLKIDLDLFTRDTPLGTIFDEFRRLSSMEDDLFAYELGVLEDFYFPCVEQPYDNLKNEGVVSTWLIQSYRKQFEEYMEIKRRLEVNGINTDVECDPTNVEFLKWLASKFNNHKTMDWYTKNALWLYWKRGDDEEVLTYDELSDLKEESLREDTDIVEIFRIETDIFDFETPLCKEFKEFNHLLQIDVDMLIGDLPGFKTCEDYKNACIYEWNKEVPWVKEKSWFDDGTWKEPNDDICHECKTFSFKSGHVEWPNCNSSKDGYYNGGNLSGMIQVGNMTYFQNYKWYEGLEDGDLKEEALKEKAILEGSWGHENREGKNLCSWWKESFEDEESREDAWSNYLSSDDNDAIQVNQERVDNHEPMEDDDDDIGDLDDYLIPQDASYYVDEEEERFKERRSKLLGIPYKKPPTFKYEKFEDLIWRIQHHGYGVSTVLYKVLNKNDGSGGMNIIWNLMCASHAGIQMFFRYITQNVAHKLYLEDHTEQIPREFSN